MNLRPYQHKLKTDTRAAWQAGHKNVLVVSPTGSGKTVLFSEELKETDGASVAIAHRQELVSQISLALSRDEVRFRVIGPENVVREIVQQEMEELGRSYYHPNAPCAAAGVDTLVSWAKPTSPHYHEIMTWAPRVRKWVQDEAHHLLKANKWGQAIDLFPNALGMGVTATPERADGRGLGRHHDGVFDHMIVGPGMRDLINGLPDWEGNRTRYLTEYRVIVYQSKDFKIDSVGVGQDGDYIRKQLALQTRDSSVMGDVIDGYLRFARGKLGVTFAPDVETASELAVRFQQAGVPAEVLSAKTPGRQRREILRRFRRREILQLVNVDLFGEGFDLPAIEVVSMARATQSYALYCLDPETEILTPDGWKRHDQVGAEVMAFDPTDGGVHAVPVTGTVKRSLYPGETMYQMAGPHLDFVVSGKHDLLVKGRGKTCKGWQKQHAEDVATRGAMYRVPVAGNGVFSGSGLTKDELHFLGWFLSDGSINRANNAFIISQAVGKTKHIKSIRQSLIGCGFKFWEGEYKRRNVPETHKNLHRFTVSKGEPRGRDKHLTGWGRLEKWVDKSVPACYDTMTRNEFLVLLETLNLGDGTNEHRSLDYIKNTLTIACGTNYEMADRIQALCVTRGLRCNASRVQYGERAGWAYLHIRDTQTATIAGVNVADGKISGKKKYKRSRLVAAGDRPEFVWCVTNPLGTLITRRNGKVVIMGNCQQFGRALRLLEGKDRAIIIDHVGNVIRHQGPPDRYREWTLDRRERKAKQEDDGSIPWRHCLNPACMAPFERIEPACPYCGWVPVPVDRSSVEFTDGDPYELSDQVLAALRGEVDKVWEHPDAMRSRLQNAHQPYANAKHVANLHAERLNSLQALKDATAWWAGYRRAAGQSDKKSYREFYYKFGVDVVTMQTLKKPEAEALTQRIYTDIAQFNRGVAA